jgi:hypothetical protein
MNLREELNQHISNLHKKQKERTGDDGLFTTTIIDEILKILEQKGLLNNGTK